jgi:hypothetical protein
MCHTFYLPGSPLASHIPVNPRDSSTIKYQSGRARSAPPVSVLFGRLVAIVSVSWQSDDDAPVGSPYNTVYFAVIDGHQTLMNQYAEFYSVVAEYPKPEKRSRIVLPLPRILEKVIFARVHRLDATLQARGLGTGLAVIPLQLI